MKQILSFYIIIGTTIKASPGVKIVKNIRVRAAPNHWLWNNVKSPILYLPEFLRTSLLFLLPYNDIDEGTKVEITTHWPSDIYIARQIGETCGLGEDSLRNDGWEQCLDEATDNQRPAFVRVNMYDYREFCGCIPIPSELISEIHLELWHKKVDGNKITELPAIAADQEQTEIKPAIAIFVVEGKIH